MERKTNALLAKIYQAYTANYLYKILSSGGVNMGSQLKKQIVVGVGLLALICLLVFSSSLSTIAQQCKGPNLNLTVEDTRGAIANLTCGYIGVDTLSSLDCWTESNSKLSFEFSKIRRITPVRDATGKAVSSLGGTLLVTVELKTGDSRRLYISGSGSVGGNDAMGKQAFTFANIKSVEFK
jgi:hypothetical protein